MKSFTSLPDMRPLIGLIMAATFSTVVRAGTAEAPKPAGQVFFDDFSYRSVAEFETHGWKVRTAEGWPGIQGATWRQENVTFPGDSAPAERGVLRMTSTTDGTPAGTFQTQICQQRKFREGTYAARVRFSPVPAPGQAADGVVESFYAISVVEPRGHPDYSECDFEYLPSGGWGQKKAALFVTTWITSEPKPDGTNDAFSGATPGELSAWHVLVLQVAGGHVRYFLDGKPVGDHSGPCYPREPMSINFNVWFTREGVAPSREPRRYEEEIDWVYFEKGVALDPGEIGLRVEALRQAGVTQKDTVESLGLPCPCNM